MTTKTMTTTTKTTTNSPGQPRLGDDRLDPVEEVAVLRLLPAELVVDQLDLDGLLGRRNEGGLGGSRTESGDEALGLDAKKKG